jgi:mycoredoxin
VGAVGLEPCVELAQRLGAKSIEATLGIAAHLHEPRVAQHLQVTRHARLVHSDTGDEIADGALAVAHLVEDAATRRLGDHAHDVEGIADGFERCGHASIIRHGIYMRKHIFTATQAGEASGPRVGEAVEMKADDEIVLYTRPGCPYCFSLRAGLRRARLPFREIDIWQDPAAAAFVRSVANGNETVPTVTVGDVSMVNPSARQVRAVLDRGR